jgi:hypothetical protein
VVAMVAIAVKRIKLFDIFEFFERDYAPI